MPKGGRKNRKRYRTFLFFGKEKTRRNFLNLTLQKLILHTKIKLFVSISSCKRWVAKPELDRLIFKIRVSLQSKLVLCTNKRRSLYSVPSRREHPSWTSAGDWEVVLIFEIVIWIFSSRGGYRYFFRFLVYRGNTYHGRFLFFNYRGNTYHGSFFVVTGKSLPR